MESHNCAANHAIKTKLCRSTFTPEQTAPEHDILPLASIVPHATKRILIKLNTNTSLQTILSKVLDKLPLKQLLVMHPVHDQRKPLNATNISLNVSHTHSSQ